MEVVFTVQFHLLALVGNNNLISILRTLTRIELFLFSEFYYNHPLLKDVFDKNNNLFKKYDSIVQMSASFAVGDTEKRGLSLVEEDAIINCSENMWCSLFHVLALSSVIRKKINLH